MNFLMMTAALKRKEAEQANKCKGFDDFSLNDETPCEMAESEMIARWFLWVSLGVIASTFIACALILLSI